VPKALRVLGKAVFSETAIMIRRSPRLIVSLLVAALIAVAAAAPPPSAAAAGVPVFVDGAWLERHLDDPEVVIVDMSDETQYQRFHLPGAVHLPYGALLTEREPDKVPVRLDDARLAMLLGRLGITRRHHVVVYDDLGGLNAARLFWELEHIGHPKVSVLDGGLVRWILDGRRVVNTPAAARAATHYELTGAGRDNEASLSEVRSAAAGRQAALLLDVRTAEEYLGDPKNPRTGHIPGARWWPWEQAVDFARGFVFADRERLRDRFRQAGLSEPDRPVITYCRSGHRAAHTYLTLRALGFERVRLYASSMNEYARIPDAPLRQGPSP
jgi:thiosulfate/3-mercaptopyruvate sulfurtransferase